MNSKANGSYNSNSFSSSMNNNNNTTDVDYFAAS